MLGTVKFFKKDKGYGFLTDSSDPRLELFFHIKDFVAYTMKSDVQKGDLLEYERGVTQEPGPKQGTPRAVKIILLDADKT